MRKEHWDNNTLARGAAANDRLSLGATPWPQVANFTSRRTPSSAIISTTVLSRSFTVLRAILYSPQKREALRGKPGSL
jgi:hypothetical protein